MRAIGWTLPGAAALVGLLCFILPGLTALTDALRLEDLSPAALSLRQCALLTRTIGLSLCAGALATLLGAGLAAGLTATPAARTATRFVCLLVLLTPPYIFAYASSLLVLPAGIVVAPVLADPWRAWLTTTGRAVLSLAAWTAPVAAFLLAAGWLRSARAAYALAILDASPLAALCRAALPALAPWLAVSTALCTLLALTEYSVCHLCLVQTWNTEVLAAIQAGGPAGRAVLLAWPLVALVLGLIALILPFRSRLLEAMRPRLQPGSDDRLATAARANRVRTLAALAAATLLAAPAAILILSLPDVASLRTSWRTYSGEWLAAARIAGGAMLLALLLTLGADWMRLPRRPFVRPGAGRIASTAFAVWLPAAAVFAALPPALVGDALAACYARTEPLRDSFWIVSLTAVARFAVLPLATGWLSGEAVDGQLADAAACDGADSSAYFLRVRLPLCAGPVAAATLALGLLAAGEVAAAQLVTPPGVRNLAVTALNAIHFGRDEVVIALCVQWLALSALAAGLLPRMARATALNF